jgi:hypothetical protein
MSFLKGLFGGNKSAGSDKSVSHDKPFSSEKPSRGKGLPPEERATLEEYLAAAEPLLERLDSEYRQWLEKAGVTAGTDVTAINDPKGQHSGVFVWRTIETERNFTQLHAPPRARRLHDAYCQSVEGRHQAASMIYDALQVADIRPPQAHLQAASQDLAHAEKLWKQGEQQRQDLDKLLH